MHESRNPKKPDILVLLTYEKPSKKPKSQTIRPVITQKLVARLCSLKINDARKVT